MSVDVARIIDAAATVYGVPAFEIRSRLRTAAVAEARHMAMLVARDTTRASYPELGRAFQRDHTTVLHGVRRAEELVIEDRFALERMRQIRELVA